MREYYPGPLDDETIDYLLDKGIDLEDGDAIEEALKEREEKALEDYEDRRC